MSALHKIKSLRDQVLPFATKQNALALVNPILKNMSSREAVTARLKPVLEKGKIEFLDLGGWAPVEGYLTIHLSSVEPYGVIMTPEFTLEQVLDEKTGFPKTQPRRLEQLAVSLHFNILGGLPLEDGCLRGINLSHIFEHFDLETGRGIMRECQRVLRPGGIMRVSCPDLKKYARAYLDQDADFFRKISTPAFCNYRNLPSPGSVFAAKAYDAHNGHKWFYDADTVMTMMKASGFSSAAEKELHVTSLPRIADVEPSYRLVESFYVEGVR